MRYFLRICVVFFLVCFAGLAHADTKVYFSPNGGCQEAVINAIKKAHATIDVAMFSFTSRDIAHALMDAKQRGVKVRIVFDTFEIKDKFSKSRLLIHKGFDVKFHLGPGLMHNKFAVIDNRTVLTGSFNWTVTAEKKNSENLLVITDGQVAGKFAKQFKHLWSQSGEGQLKEQAQSAAKAE